MAGYIRSLIDPSVLRRNVRKQDLWVFLCGPGVGTSGFGGREAIRAALTRYHIRVDFGEDLLSPSRRGIRSRPLDLQSLESEVAHKVDFTILILDSPGAIAELGTFSMIPNIVPRLFVAVPAAFYRSSSYIARGPLSIVAKYNRTNVFYFDPDDMQTIIDNVKLPIAFFKYASTRSDYFSEVRQGYRNTPYINDYYPKYINPLRNEFIAASVMAGIIVLRNPTFHELVKRLHVSTDDVKAALKILFGRNKIAKLKGTYSPLTDFSDEMLKPFSGTALSRLKAIVYAED